MQLAPSHFREYVPFGVFFLVVGAAQTVHAIELALRPTRRLALFMAFGSAGLVGLWWLSRTIGLPFGPDPGRPEEIGLADGICNSLELLAMLLCLVLVVHGPRRHVRRVWLAVVGTLSSALLATGVTTTVYSLAWPENPAPVVVNATTPAPITTSAMAGPTGNTLHFIGGIATSFFLPLGYLGMSLLACGARPGSPRCR